MLEILFLDFGDYCKNNYLDIIVAIGTIGAAWSAYYAASNALKIHKDSESKRNLDKKIENIEELIKLLNSLNIDILMIKGVFDNLKSDLKKAKKEKNPYLYKRIPDQLLFYTNNISSLYKISDSLDKTLLGNIMSSYKSISNIYTQYNLLADMCDDTNNVSKDIMLGNCNSENIENAKAGLEDRSRSIVKNYTKIIKNIENLIKGIDKTYIQIKYNISNLNNELRQCKTPIEDIIAAANKFNGKESQYNLGMMYYKGIRVNKNDKKAIYWVEKSAKQGFVGAQFLLSSIYYNKKYKNKSDLLLSYIWILVVKLSNEYSKSKDVLNLEAYIKSKLTPKQIIKAEKLKEELLKEINQNNSTE